MFEALRKLIETANATPEAFVHGDMGNWVDIEFPDTYTAVKFARDFDVNERGSFVVQFLIPPRNFGHEVTLTFTYAGMVA